MIDGIDRWHALGTRVELMPHDNAFRHQAYTSPRVTAPHEFVPAPKPLPPEAGDFQAALRRWGGALRRHGVREILLVHGTFTGTDVTGLIGQLERYLPDLAGRLREQEKLLVDSLIGDICNYSPEFGERLAEGINDLCDDPTYVGPPIRVRQFSWSGENHHLGRADGAVRLAVELSRNALGPDDRVVVWGHSHAGNVFAILTHLLGGSQETVERFFAATRWNYIAPVRRVVDVPIWAEARERILERRLPIPDFVTFGTPIRYGWETAGYRSLLHVIHHRKCRTDHPERAPFPPSVEQILLASAGDFLQQFAIAGTNFPINPCSFRQWVVEAKLQELLQKRVRRIDAWHYLHEGIRVPEEGMTLLVDYHAGDEGLAVIMAGHAVYTFTRWLPFHLELFVRYSLENSPHDHLRASDHDGR